jgi:HAD superfamily hydrolase (TIGR01549 family)
VHEAAAVFFDVDFTLIHPGPRFQGVGYQEACARRGVAIDPARFDAAVAGAGAVLKSAEAVYDADIYIRYTARIIELMGGTGAAVDRAARDLYDEWGEHHHFTLYDDVKETLEILAPRYSLGLISNSHRCLESFQEHFELTGLIAVTVSSAELGILKPHPGIFEAALERLGVPASRAVMVGDSLTHDVEGARQAGMRGVWLVRGARRTSTPIDVPTISTLRDLPAWLLEP